MNYKIAYLFISITGSIALTQPLFAAGCSPDGEFDPNKPEASGYRKVFDDEFDSISSIDINNNRTGNYNWYIQPFFGWRPMPSDDISVADGVLMLNGSSAVGYGIATAAPADNEQGYVGHVFGGGAYFEARIAYDPETVDYKNGWPSFWAMAVEHMAQKKADQWPGQLTGYEHFIEDDFFEYDTSFAGISTFGGAIHDWYGVYKVTCPSGFCKVSNDGTSLFNNFVNKLQNTEAIDWTQFHTIGQLWVAGNNDNGNIGYIQTYFDAVATNDRVTWVDQGDGAPPPSGVFAFSIMDKQHLVVILGTGKNQPMKIDRVRVWQIPECAK